jgi:hypothetical protein
MLNVECRMLNATRPDFFVARFFNSTKLSYRGVPASDRAVPALHPTGAANDRLSSVFAEPNQIGGFWPIVNKIVHQMTLPP